jgi:hypothetical protein
MFSSGNLCQGSDVQTIIKAYQLNKRNKTRDIILLKKKEAKGVE